MDLSIIIVNYNVKEFLQNLIHSVYKASQNISCEIIVVDNASDDGSVEFLQEKFPEIKLIVNKDNLGFSKANNIGLKEAKGKYILLLNPDTLVREDTFEKMIDFFEQTNEAGLAGCKILNPDGTLQLACRRSFPGPWTSFCKVTGLSSFFPKNRLFARYNLTYLDENKTYEVDAISGSFMMFPRTVYEKVGGLDEQFFMYGEDLDLCYRIQKAGYKVYYVHSTQIIHYKGESTKRSSFDETKVFYNAMHLFVKKHLSSSLLVEIILQSAIVLRKFFAFIGKRKLIVLSVILDFLFFNLALKIAGDVYQSYTNWQGFPEYSLPVIYTTPAIIHILVSASLGAYKKNYLSVLRVFASIIISFFILSSLTFFFKDFAYSRAVLLITYIFLFFSLFLWRFILKLFFKVGNQYQESARKKTIVVGINSPAINIAVKLKTKHTDIHSVTGLISLSNKDVGKNIEGFEVVGNIENISKVIKDKKITEVIFPSDEISYNQMMSIVASLQDENVEFKLVGNNMDFLVGKTSVSILDDLSIIEIKYNISNPVFKFTKGLFDYSLAFFVLFLVYPFIYLISLPGRKKSRFIEFILNVPLIFTGKVSFVGPRDPSEVKNLYLGKRGLTGLWFIENSEGEETGKLDIFYAKNQNIWLDLEILGKSLNKMWNKS
ncbi:MAG: glycosyltransferase [Ignavibacteriaceae bacterium]